MKNNYALYGALDRIANCEQDCSDADAVAHMREIARLALSAENNKRYVLYSWVKTSSAHAYPVRHFSGTWEECEKRRAQSNFPESMGIADCLPPAY